MSRYVIWTEDNELEVVVGFDDGFEAFFLTVADGSENNDEPESYLFHNMAHHPKVGMTLDDVRSALDQLGIELPNDLAGKLADDARRTGFALPAGSPASPASLVAISRGNARTKVRVVGWDPAD